MHVVEVLRDCDPLFGDRSSPRLDCLGEERRERDRRLLGEGAVLGAGEREEALEQPVGLVEALAQLGVEHLKLWRERPGLGSRDIERGTHHRQRRA
jgi:hypothetical protein